MRLRAVARGDATHPAERTIVGLLKTEFTKLFLSKRQKDESKICDGNRSAKSPRVGSTCKALTGYRRCCFCIHTEKHWIARTAVKARLQCEARSYDSFGSTAVFADNVIFLHNNCRAQTARKYRTVADHDRGQPQILGRRISPSLNS